MVHRVRWLFASSSLDSNVYEAATAPGGQFGVDSNVAGRLDCAPVGFLSQAGARRLRDLLNRSRGRSMAVDSLRRAAAGAPLYNPAFEHDACGVGLIVDIHGRGSHDIVTRALAGLVNLTHRGGVGADARTGDGAGILTQIPTRLLAPDLAAGELGVAMTFLPTQETMAAKARAIFVEALENRGLPVLGWRDLPTDNRTPVSKLIADAALRGLVRA